jgi:adenylate kinase family enzyme
MQPAKWHILGAPGSGVSTLGKALAARLQIPHFDTDDYHWFTDDALPYRRRRNPEHRRQLMRKDFAENASWVLSGALCGWGDEFIPQFDQVVYLWLPAEIRLARIRERERLRYGADRIGPGGDLNGVFEKFLAWAAAYDNDSDNVRSRAKELEWLAALNCPVLRIETEMELAEMVSLCLKTI